MSKKETTTKKVKMVVTFEVEVPSYVDATHPEFLQELKEELQTAIGGEWEAERVALPVIRTTHLNLSLQETFLQRPKENKPPTEGGTA